MTPNEIRVLRQVMEGLKTARQITTFLKSRHRTFYTYDQVFNILKRMEKKGWVSRTPGKRPCRWFLNREGRRLMWGEVND